MLQNVVVFDSYLFIIFFMVQHNGMQNLKKKGIFVLRTSYLKGTISGVNIFHGLMILFCILQLPLV